MFADDETVDGMPVKHDLIDGDAFRAAARRISDPNVSGFA
jgi:hypothetical protein